MKLEISLFRFDKNSDYLPYYTKHFLKIENEKNLLDILNTIHYKDNFSFENSENFDLVVNGMYVKASLSLQEIKEDFGKELTIEPISIRRAYSDLLINDDDFKSKITLLNDHMDEGDEEGYEELKQYFYASNTLTYYPEYVGDSLLIFAHDLIEKHPKRKSKIIKKINKELFNASYHTCLKNRIYKFDEEIAKKIHDVQEKSDLREDIANQNFRVNKTLIIDFDKFADDYEIKHDFKDFTYAYYSSNNEKKYNDFLNSLKAKNLNLETLKLDLAKNTFNSNHDISFQVATTILLDAFDNNCDFIVVDSDEDFYLFDYNRKELERLCGREVLIPVLHINEVQKLASGDHKTVKRTLEKHQVNPEII